MGGAVRSELMGVIPNDHDYVVVGSSIEEMEKLGFEKVGKDFPVFLHPITGDEYALARKDKKVAVGHNGFDCLFSPDISLEEDLFRRDFTMNSIAKDLKTGTLIDPYNGIQDIKNKVIRHTNELAFADDPVRLLRAARFLAQFGEEWSIAKETKALFLDASKELHAIPRDRIWKEVSKVLKSKHPHLFFETLKNFGIFPEIDALIDLPQRADYHPEGCVFTHNQLVIKYAATQGFSDIVVFGALCHDLGKAITYRENGNYNNHESVGVDVVNSFADRIGAPKKFKQFAMACAKHHTKTHHAFVLKPITIYGVLDGFGVTRGNDFACVFLDFLKVCESDYKGRGEPFCSSNIPEQARMKEYLNAFLSLDKKLYVKELINNGNSGEQLSYAIKQEQLRRIQQIKESKN